MNVTFTVRRIGEIVFVAERIGSMPMIEHGPMPRDFAGPFMDERIEWLKDQIAKGWK